MPHYKNEPRCNELRKELRENNEVLMDVDGSSSTMNTGTVDIEDQLELKALGLSVIDQLSFEQNVEAAVDRAVAEHSRKQKLQILKKEIKETKQNLRKLENKEEEYQYRLEGMRKRLTDPRQYLAVEKSLSENSDEIKCLQKKKLQLEETVQLAEKDQTKLDELDLQLEEGELLDDSDEETKKKFESNKARLIREGKMTPFGTVMQSEQDKIRHGNTGFFKRPVSSEISENVASRYEFDSCNPPSIAKENASQVEKADQQINCGPREMTKFEKYLQDQTDRQKSCFTANEGKKRKCLVTRQSYGFAKKRTKRLQEFTSTMDSSNDTSSGTSGQCSVTPKKSSKCLKMKVLHPKRHWKERNIGSRTSELDSDQRKRPRKPLSESVVLADSDNEENSGSEYIPSDEEMSSDGDEDIDEHNELSERMKVAKNSKMADKSSAVRCKQRSVASSRGTRKTRKVRDDGNIEDYKNRIEIWKRERVKMKRDKILKGEDIDSDEEDGCEEFDGGFKIPVSVWNKLYKYQKTCVRWLWELHCQGCGGILGDEMGLGKTIEVLSFLIGLSYSGVIRTGQKWKGLGPVLIVSPATVLHQWVKEFHKWWPPFRVAVLHDSGTYRGKRAALIHTINRNNGIMITSYTGLLGQLQVLLQYDWHYIILDEGHKIRNPEAQITVAVKRFQTPHRLILSGSPIQNSLKELWSLFDFVFPGKLGTLPVFMQQFAVPITQGGYANASRLEVQTAYRCAVILRDTINPYLLRRMKNDVRSHLTLPDKNEQVLFCGLTDEQRILYRDYIDGKEVQFIMKGRIQVFVGLINLRKICNHPDLYSGGPKYLVGEDISGLQPENAYGWWKLSGKMLVLHAVLKLWKAQDHRVLLFTQSRQMLCILEKFLQDQAYTYVKMDGSTGVGSRQPLIEKYNHDSSIFIFLLTTRVGGLGVNLTGADRVVIYDPDWNPSTDIQARERAWRIGQTRHVTIYRLLTAGTIEEKIYHRQIFKQFLTNRVLKDPKQQRFFKTNDLYELFTLSEGQKEKTESSAIFAGLGSEVKIKVKRRTKEPGKGEEKDPPNKTLNVKDKLCFVSYGKELHKTKPKLKCVLDKPRKTKDEKSGNCDADKNYETVKEEVEKDSTSEGEQKNVTFDNEEGLRTSENTNSKTMGESEICCTSDEGKLSTLEDKDASAEETKFTDGESSSKLEEINDCAIAHGAGVGIDDAQQSSYPDNEFAQINECESQPLWGDAHRKNKQPSESQSNDDSKTIQLSELPSYDDSKTTQPGELQSDDDRKTTQPSESQSNADSTIKQPNESLSNDSSDLLNGYIDPKRRAKMLQLAKLLSKKIEENKTRVAEIKVTVKDRKKHKKNKKKGKKFEGTRIEYLVKNRVYKGPEASEDQEAKAESKAQDEFVLSKLLKKSGVHSALSHDVIINSADPDYLLLEGEAERVAKEAIQQVRQSRAQYFDNQGDGAKRRSKKEPRFGRMNSKLIETSGTKKKLKHQRRALKEHMFNGGISEESSSDPDEPDDKSSLRSDLEEPNNKSSLKPDLGKSGTETSADGISSTSMSLSSTELLKRMRRRNCRVEDLEEAQSTTAVRRRTVNDEEEFDSAYPSTAETQCDQESGPENTELQPHIELLTDIRNFIAFQAAFDGCASTDEIVSRFKDRLPPAQSHIFKALLNEICDFRRDSSGKGMWYMKGEFR